MVKQIKLQEVIIMLNCEDMYDCCDCGGSDCGCVYCWSCNACENCLAGNDKECLRT